MLASQVSHIVRFPLYLIHSSSDGLSDSSFSLSSSSGRSPHRSRFRPADTLEGDKSLLNTFNRGKLQRIFYQGELILTCRIQSVESRYSIAVEHPEMAVVTGEQAGFTGGHNMVAHSITAGRGNKEETCVSTLLGALLKSANSTSGGLLSNRCLFLPCVQQQQRPGNTKEAP